MYGHVSLFGLTPRRACDTSCPARAQPILLCELVCVSGLASSQPWPHCGVFAHPPWCLCQLHKHACAYRHKPHSQTTHHRVSPTHSGPSAPVHFLFGSRKPFTSPKLGSRSVGPAWTNRAAPTLAQERSGIGRERSQTVEPPVFAPENVSRSTAQLAKKVRRQRILSDYLPKSCTAVRLSKSA